MDNRSRHLNLLALSILVGGQLAIAEAALAKDLPGKAVHSIATHQPIAQAAPSPIEITAIQLEETETGLQVVIETAGGELTVPTTTVSGDALTAEISNAVLALPDDEFLEFTPAEGIALVQVTALPGDRVQVVITGTDAPPTADINATATGLTLSVAPGVAQAGEEDDAIRILVEGEDGRRYAEPNAVTGTRTDIPQIEVPQAIQVIPEAVLEDQQVIRLNDALRNAPGVVQGNTFGGARENFVIRGFEGAAILQDGFRAEDTASVSFQETAILQQVEVLRGPASILYGNLEPGGVINLITEQPLATPAIETAFQLGSYGLIRPTLDLTGPINASGSIRYRLNAVYESAEGFRDFETDVERVFVSPVLAFDLGDRTDLILELQYFDDERPFDRGIPPLGDEIPDVPLDTVLGEPNDFVSVENIAVGYRLEHRFSDNWRLRNRFRYSNIDSSSLRAELSEPLGGLNPETGMINRAFIFNENSLESYEVQTEVVGEFSTGSINHTLLAGVDLFFAESEAFTSSEPTVPVNLFDPEIGRVPEPDVPLAFTTGDSRSELSRVGLFLQDQIELIPEVNLLLGGRLDFFSQSSEAEPITIPGFPSTPGRESDQSQTAFSPRVGIVYQPIDELALYASYSRSFEPNTLTSTTVDGDFLDPEEAEQFEIGVKTELFDGRLVATLAFFDISLSNVAADDPDNPTFVVPIGEQTSRGIEFNVTGELLPGWNVVAGLSLLDAEIEESPDFPDGATPANTPDTTASLWTTYEIQSGGFAGLGFGIGLFYVGERQGDDSNTFTLDDYLRTDAAIYYRQDNVRLGLNFRNIFDIDYFENGGFLRRGALPGEPFTVVGSISITF